MIALINKKIEFLFLNYKNRDIIFRDIFPFDSFSELILLASSIIIYITWSDFLIWSPYNIGVLLAQWQPRLYLKNKTK